MTANQFLTAEGKCVGNSNNSVVWFQPKPGKLVLELSWSNLVPANVSASSRTLEKYTKQCSDDDLR